MGLIDIGRPIHKLYRNRLGGSRLLNRARDAGPQFDKTPIYNS